jgi:hypothetical protein
MFDHTFGAEDLFASTAIELDLLSLMEAAHLPDHLSLLVFFRENRTVLMRLSQERIIDG